MILVVMKGDELVCAEAHEEAYQDDHSWAIHGAFEFAHHLRDLRVSARHVEYLRQLRLLRLGRALLCDSRIRTASSLGLRVYENLFFQGRQSKSCHLCGIKSTRITRWIRENSDKASSRLVQGRQAHILGQGVGAVGGERPALLSGVAARRELSIAVTTSCRIPSGCKQIQHRPCGDACLDF